MDSKEDCPLGSWLYKSEEEIRRTEFEEKRATAKQKRKQEKDEHLTQWWSEGRPFKILKTVDKPNNKMMHGEYAGSVEGRFIVFYCQYLEGNKEKFEIHLNRKQRKGKMVTSNG